MSTNKLETDDAIEQPISSVYEDVNNMLNEGRDRKSIEQTIRNKISKRTKD